MNDARTNRKIRVLVVDDHVLLRDGLGYAINKEEDMCLVGEAGTGLAAVKEFHRLMPDITVMDIAMPGICGITAMHEIHRDVPGAKIIILTTFKGDTQIARALKSGAAGFILKNARPRDFIASIRDAFRGERRITPEVADELARHMDSATLTDRETQVLNLVSRGNSNKRIAGELSITEETVKAHIRKVLAKLNASDRTHAVTIALKRGIISYDQILFQAG